MRALLGLCGLMLAVSTLNAAAAYAARVEVRCAPVVVQEQRCGPADAPAYWHKPVECDRV